MNNNLLSLFIKAGKVSTDTRKIEKGSIFFALKGPNFNGNKYAKQAIEKGAFKAVIDEDEFQNEDTILVEDVLKALQKLAADYRKTLKTKIIGLTGSNGKTTTKELLTLALASKFKVFSTPGNLNNHIGVPLTLLQISKETDFAIVEMGDNKPGDIIELCEIANPDIGFITNIGMDHLEGYGTMEGNIATKKELVDFLEKKNKPFIYCADSENVPQIISSKTTSIEINSFLKNSNFKALPSNPFVNYKVQEVVWKTNLVGDYNIENIKFAIAISLYFGADPNLLNKAICNYIPSNNRSQYLKTENNEVILDAYNANPSSVANAIESFLKIRSSLPKVLILGDMLELGQISEQEHLKVLERVFQLPEIKGVFVGSIYSKFKSKYNFSFFENTQQAFEFFEKESIKKALVLFKGSRGIALEKLLPNF